MFVEFGSLTSDEDRGGLVVAPDSDERVDDGAVEDDV